MKSLGMLSDVYVREASRIVWIMKFDVFQWTLFRFWQNEKHYEESKGETKFHSALVELASDFDE